MNLWLDNGSTTKYPGVHLIYNLLDIQKFPEVSESWVPLSLGLGSMRDVELSSIAHEQTGTQSDFMLSLFLKDPEYLELCLVVSSNEPSHEIMALFIHRTLILQMRMHSHPVGLDVWILDTPFVYFFTLCMWTAKALARLIRTGSPELSQVAYVISTIISWAGSNVLPYISVVLLLLHVLVLWDYKAQTFYLKDKYCSTWG